MSLKVNENLVIDDKEFLEQTHLHKNVLLNGEIFKIEGSVIFTGTINYTFTDECARCLKEFGNVVEAIRPMPVYDTPGFIDHVGRM